MSSMISDATFLETNLEVCTSANQQSVVATLQPLPLDPIVLTGLVTKPMAMTEKC